LLRGLPSTSIAVSGSVLLAAGAKGGINCPTVDGPSPSRERELSSQAFLDLEGMIAGDLTVSQQDGPSSLTLELALLSLLMLDVIML
jgi:hypothetical protein